MAVRMWAGVHPHICDNLRFCFDSGNKCQTRLMTKCLRTLLGRNTPRALGRASAYRRAFVLILRGEGVASHLLAALSCSSSHSPRGARSPADACGSVSGMMTSCRDVDECKCLKCHRLLCSCNTSFGDAEACSLVVKRDRGLKTLHWRSIVSHCLTACSFGRGLWNKKSNNI